MRKSIGVGLMLSMVLAVAGCEGPGPASTKLQVSVSIPPQAYFVRRIGGDKVEVHVVVPPYLDPHEYDPTPAQLARLTRSRLYVKTGLAEFTFEPRLIDPTLAAHPDMHVVDMSKGIRLRRIGEDEVPLAGTAVDADTQAGARDPHIWTDPANARIIVRNIYEGLVAVEPASQAYFQTNLNSLLADIDAVDAEIEKTLADYRGGYFMDYHPAWGCFAQAYGLHQVCIEVEGKEPGPKDLERVIDLGREKRIKVIFVQKGFDRRSAQVVADAIGAKVVEIDPMAEDWLTNMKTVADTFKRALAKES